MLEFGQALLEGVVFLARHVGHFRVAALHHLGEIIEFGARSPQLAGLLGHRLQLGVLLGELDDFIGIARGAQAGFHLFEPVDHLGESGFGCVHGLRLSPSDGEENPDRLFSRLPAGISPRHITAITLRTVITINTIEEAEKTAKRTGTKFHSAWISEWRMRSAT